MELLDSLRWRYATKKFDPEKVVDSNKVTALLEAANLTATSYGLQPFKFLLIRNQAIQDQLVESSYQQQQVAEASHVIVIATRTDIDEKYIEDYAAMMESQRDLSSGSLDQYKSMMVGSILGMSESERQRWASKQVYLAAGTLLAACATMEIDACPMEGFVPAQYNEILGLDTMNLNATIVVPIGYRDDGDATQHYLKVRRPLAEMVVEI